MSYFLCQQIIEEEYKSSTQYSFSSICEGIVKPPPPPKKKKKKGKFGAPIWLNDKFDHLPLLKFEINLKCKSAAYSVSE